MVIQKTDKERIGGRWIILRKNEDSVAVNIYMYLKEIRKQNDRIFLVLRRKTGITCFMIGPPDE